MDTVKDRWTINQEHGGDDLIELIDRAREIRESADKMIQQLEKGSTATPLNTAESIENLAKTQITMIRAYILRGEQEANKKDTPTSNDPTTH